MNGPYRHWGIFVRLCTAIGIMLLTYALLGSRTAIAQTARPFTIFDGLLYLGKPDTRLRGLVPVAGSGDLWRPGVSEENVDEVRIRSMFEPFRKSNGFY